MIWAGPIVAIDVDQPRIDTALPTPQGTFTIQQSFQAHHDGLREIEVTMVRPSTADTRTGGRLSLRVWDDTGQLVTVEHLDSHALVHNQVHVLRFSPQAQSAGRRYMLEISGDADNPVSVWGYSLDVYAAGAVTFTDEQPSPAADLRFTTRYQLTGHEAITLLIDTSLANGWFLLLALAFLVLPGCLLLLVGPSRWWRGWDTAAWWGTSLALGVSIWPLLWFALTLSGLRLAGWSLWLIFVLGWAAVIFLRRRSGLAAKLPSPQPVTRSPHHLIILSLLLILSLAVRLLAVRDVTFPLWVDASRHALITTVMGHTGQTISSYAPFLQVDEFPYHFGFHTLSTSLLLMTGRPLNELLLILGQLLNALTPLTVYTAVWFLAPGRSADRRGAGLLAAFLVALPFFFPAYYATWGRFTQLTAVLLLPVLLALTWRLMSGGDAWQHAWWLVGLLAAGLFLIHFRVFLFYLPFVAVAWLANQGHNGRRLVAAGVLGLLLVSPRLWQLWRTTNPVQRGTYTIPGYNEFPANYVTVGWERAFIALAAIALCFVLIAGILRRRWAVLPLALAAWVALLFMLLSGRRLGLPETSLVNLNSMVIILFIPLALFLALTAERAWRWLRLNHWLLQLLAYTATGGALLAALLFGIRQQITILNAQTILVQPADLAGLEWVAANVPEQATVAVNSWRWLGNAWAGSDGGAWIVPLTGRRSTTPPADYGYSRVLVETVRSFNEAATAVTDWSAPEAADWLRQQGVDYIFVGARGGFFDPAALARNPKLTLRYGHDGVFVFELGD